MWLSWPDSDPTELAGDGDLGEVLGIEVCQSAGVPAGIAGNSDSKSGASTAIMLCAWCSCNVSWLSAPMTQKFSL